jgi:hypothetical protein
MTLMPAILPAVRRAPGPGQRSPGRGHVGVSWYAADTTNVPIGTTLPAAGFVAYTGRPRHKA